MNTERQGYVVTSVIYRLFVKKPRAQLDNGVIVYIHVYAHNEEEAKVLAEEEAKVLAEEQAKHDYFVDDYKFVKISKSENWMSERLAECNFIISENQ